MIVEIVARGAARLADAGFSSDEAKIDAAVLARHVLTWDTATWLMRQREPEPDGFSEAFDRAIARRATHEPVAYIIGTREFYGRDFIVTPAVLIPRPETEMLIDAVLGLERREPLSIRRDAIFEVGAGSGCISITLAMELPSATIIASDVSDAALGVARHNAQRHRVADRVSFHEGEFFAGLTTPVDVIVSNPPYVPLRDRATLASDVETFEPFVALFGGNDGLDCIRELVRLAPTHLNAGGYLLIEFGFGQANDIRAIIEESGLALIDIRDDLQRIPRIAIARRRQP